MIMDDGYFRKAIVEAGKGKNMFREGDPVVFYRYYSSANSEMEGNDNKEIMSKPNWYALLKTYGFYHQHL